MKLAERMKYLSEIHFYTTPDVNWKHIVEAVEMVYKDFERRTCDRCKYGEETDDGGYDIYCLKLRDYMYDIQSCTKWEAKVTK